MSHVAAVILLSLGTLMAPAPKAEQPQDKRARLDQRAHYLAESLNNPVSVIEKGAVALPFLLEGICSLASPPGSERDPKLKVVILLDLEGFNKVQRGMFDAEKVQIKFSTKMVNFSLRSLLNIIAEQIQGVVVIRKEYIEIVPRTLWCKEIGLKVPDDQPLPPLVHCDYDKVAVSRILQDLAERNNVNLVFDPLSESKIATPITIRLLNVPIETAVETMAEMVDLKVVRKANVYYVTTPERAERLRAAEEKRCVKEKNDLERQKIEASKPVKNN